MSIESIIPYIAISIYLLSNLAIGFVGYLGSKNTVDDYFLANRSLGSFVLFFTLIATNFSAFFFFRFCWSRLSYRY